MPIHTFPPLFNWFIFLLTCKYYVHLFSVSKWNTLSLSIIHLVLFFLPSLKEMEILPDNEQLKSYLRSDDVLANKQHIIPPILPSSPHSRLGLHMMERLSFLLSAHYIVKLCDHPRNNLTTRSAINLLLRWRPSPVKHVLAPKELHSFLLYHLSALKW